MKHGPHIQDLIAVRRRTLLAGLGGLPLLAIATEALAAAPRFRSVPATLADTITLPPGYRAQTLIAWTDALFDSVAPRIHLDRLTRAEQEQRFGQNNDMLALFPATYSFPAPRRQSRLLMCVNHEYVEPALTFPGLSDLRELDSARADALFAALGISIVQIDAGTPGAWRIIRDAKPGAGLNRRITPFTPVLFEGPASGHRWIEAGASAFNAGVSNIPPKAVACGTIANCAGGQTPWGTFLSAEENFDAYFGMSGASPALAEAQRDPAWIWQSGNFGAPLFSGARARFSPPPFDVTRNPYGPALYGWVVEVDPYDPHWAPRKRTALGRNKHECATTALARDGRCVVYMGDDQINEFVYKFVSRDRFNPADRLANRDLLNEGQLYVAQFFADGAGRWLALTPEAVNAAASGFTAPFVDSGDVAIRAREAANLLGATPMDRAEDVEALIDDNWVGLGQVLVVCTNNKNAHPALPGNPRREGGPASQANLAGHILRIDEDGADAAATRFRWDVFALAGDPAPGAMKTPTESGDVGYVSVKHKGKPTISGDRFACPDNICFDDSKNVWIATDGSPAVFADCNDSLLVAPTAGKAPRETKRFLVGPVGCEICGPTMAPDQRAFLVAIQHPGEADSAGTAYAETRKRAPGRKPPSSFPDGGDAWPRSAVIVVAKTDGGVIGG